MKRPILSAGIWTLVGLVFASQLYLFAIRTGRPMAWSDALLWEFPRWILWLFFVPIINRLCKILPLEKKNRIKHLILHTAASIVISVVHLCLFVVVFHLSRLLFGNSGNVMEAIRFAFPLDFHVGIVVYWMVLLLRYLHDTERRVSHLQTELARAQLQALKMQLHPHFLFNTLNSISALLHKDVETADEMIGELGEFLRLTLTNPDANEIVLRKEIDFLKCYLRIEELRFKDRLATDFEIGPETLDALLPNLILQPIVENAIHHGVSVRTGSGQIRVTTHRENGKLRISIQDDGPGASQEIREGIGLSNTRERLERLYGEQFRLEMENLSRGGFIVKIEIPFHVSATEVV
jgi:two-component system LytT family sensor kinase